jgi:hypothetical protein
MTAAADDVPERMDIRSDLKPVKETNFMNVDELYELTLDAAAELGKCLPREITKEGQGITLQMVYGMLLEIVNRVREARPKKE